MKSIFFLLMRRLRAPLLLLVTMLSLATLGLVLIPGEDAQGNVWHMDFFHAIYFVSYMATTIGFGEIPFEFTPAQRMWVTFCIYLTVGSWLFAFGRILTLFQEDALKQAFTEARFQKNVNRIRDPFYIICGYGDTGSALVQALNEQHQRAVVLDRTQEAINGLRLASLTTFVPGLACEAGLPENLRKAGLERPNCRGVVALTDDDETNLHIAISTKLLNPRLTVICRAETRETERNMHSFGTDYVIDPFEAFADRLFTALHTPNLSALHDWLSGLNPLTEPLNPPHGRWLLCGYGRFGKALYKRFRQEGIETVVIEATPDKTGLPEDARSTVEGWGTEAPTLEKAGIRQAAGIVAGTDHDTNNLSMLMTARDLKPDLFMVARQNREANTALFRAINADIVAEGSQTLAHRIRIILNTPLLKEFIRYSRGRDDSWARNLNRELAREIGSAPPRTWEVEVCEETAPVLVEAMHRNTTITVDTLLTHPFDDTRPMVCRALFLEREHEHIPLPRGHEQLKVGDRVLFCGPEISEERMRSLLFDRLSLDYVTRGQQASPA